MQNRRFCKTQLAKLYKIMQKKSNFCKIFAYVKKKYYLCNVFRKRAGTNPKKLTKKQRKNE